MKKVRREIRELMVVTEQKVKREKKELVQKEIKVQDLQLVLE